MEKCGHTHRLTQMENNVKIHRENCIKMEVWTDASISQGTAKTAGKLVQTRKRQGRIFSYRLQRERGPGDTLILDF